MDNQKKFFFSKNNSSKILAFSLFFLLIFSVWNLKNSSSEEKEEIEKADKKIEKAKQKTSQAENLAEDISQFMDLETYAGLPIGKIEIEKSEKQEGVAIFVPQSHQYPGTKPEDKANDSAEVTQNQIYETISQLHENYQVDYVMTEGELFGKVSEEEIAKLKEKIALRHKFAAQIEEVEKRFEHENGLQDLEEKKFVTNAENYLKTIDREIALTGAAHRLKAQEGEINLYGAENKETQEKCAGVVRDYIYQKDQLGNISKVASKEDLNSSKQKNSAILSRFLSLKNNPEKNLSNDFIQINQAFYSSDLKAEVNEAEDLYRQLEVNKQTPENMEKVTPSRANNPYAAINNQRELEEIMEKTEKEIQELVIDQRNKETAENFIKGMEENGEKVGILQFGAGHTEGLVKELNNQGISVVVITPEEVYERNEN